MTKKNLMQKKDPMQAPLSPNATRCNALSKQSRKQCLNAAVKGSTKCRMHGGKSLKGIASPSFKTGKHSLYAYLPDRLSERVAEIAANPKLAELRENIAVADARLSELYEQFHKSEPAEVWVALQVKFNEWQNLQNGIDGADDQEAQQRLADDAKDAFAAMLREGVAEQLKAERIWGNIIYTAEHRRKLVESESKRLKESQQTITSEEFQTFIQFILSVIKENVTDRNARQRIAEKLIPARN